MSASQRPALTEAQLLGYAGETIFARGEDYVRYVHGLRVDGSRASASVQGTRVYTVELDWSGHELEAMCTCPFSTQGDFCKHLVALGLAVIDSTAADAVGSNEFESG